MKQKTLFKMMVLGAVLILMLLALNSQSYAAITENTNTGTITVNGIEAGATVSIYQLTTVNYDYDADQPMDPPYTWKEEVGGWIFNEYPAYYEPEAFYNANLQIEDVTKFYSDLAVAIKNGPISMNTTKEITSVDTHVVFQDCEMGTYLVLVDGGYNIYTTVAVNLTPEFKDNQWMLDEKVVAPKSTSKPSITKEVYNTEIREYSYNASYGITDSFDFKIVASIPTYAEGGTATTYHIIDEPSEGLDIKYGSITIKADDNTLSEYTIFEQGEGFIIEFDYDEIKSYNYVEVLYTAELNENAIIGMVGNPNTAFLEYNNDPYEETGTRRVEATATVYTYGVEITKLDSKTYQSLPGAQFEVYDAKNYNQNQPIPMNFLADTDTAGTYYVSNDSSDAKTELQVDESGVLKLYGLAPGSYYLKETQAPSGYNIDTTLKTFGIIVDDDGYLVEVEENSNQKIRDSEGGILAVKVYNSGSFQLPTTGGIGTTIFATCGVILVGVGVILLLVVIKKKRKTK